MKKPLPALDTDLLLPPVAPDRHHYFENSTSTPFGADAEPALSQAWWLAECALAAYADEAMTRHIFQEAALHVGAPVQGTQHGGQCYVLHDDEKIIITFRGTQALKREHLGGLDAFQDMVGKVMKDMLTDAKVRFAPWTGCSGGRVHRGFAASLEELLPRIVLQVDALLNESPGRKLWLSGHSLGGALATLAADRLNGVRGLHTFGSPQVGDSEFATRFNTPGWRFRNHADVVPWLPGTALGYAHVNGGKYFNRSHELIDEPGPLALLSDGTMGLPAAISAGLDALKQGQFAGGLTPAAINDHAPLMYAVKTWNAHVSSTEA